MVKGVYLPLFIYHLLLFTISHFPFVVHAKAGSQPPNDWGWSLGGDPKNRLQTRKWKMINGKCQMENDALLPYLITPRFDVSMN